MAMTDGHRFYQWVRMPFACARHRVRFNAVSPSCYLQSGDDCWFIGYVTVYFDSLIKQVWNLKNPNQADDTFGLVFFFSRYIPLSPISNGTIQKCTEKQKIQWLCDFFFFFIQRISLRLLFHWQTSRGRTNRSFGPTHKERPFMSLNMEWNLLQY